MQRVEALIRGHLERKRLAAWKEEAMEEIEQLEEQIASREVDLLIMRRHRVERDMRAEQLIAMKNKSPTNEQSTNNEQSMNIY